MFSFLLATALAATPATGDQAKRADKLFREGRALLKADQAGQACPKLRESFELDPALGTLLNLADCEERIESLVQAWLHFNEAAAWAERNRESDRVQIAKDRASAIKTRLSWLTLSAEKPVPGLTVTVNEMPIELGSTAQSVPVNPGEATVVASAEGYAPWRTKVQIESQASVALKVPALNLKNAELQTTNQTQPPSDAPVETGLTPSPREPIAQSLVATEPAAVRGPKPGAIALIAGGGAALLGGIVGLGLTLDVHNRTMRQQPGGPDHSAPTVSQEQFEQLQWAYPLSWVLTSVGAASILGGVAWSVIPTVNGVSVQGQL